MIYTPKEAPLEAVKNAEIAKRKKGNPATRNKVKYKNLICAFDIETTNIDEIEQAIMYVWQFHIYPDITVVGRTWEEFTLFMQKLCALLDDGIYLCVFVHNLSFEFQFLRGIYEFDLGEVFAVDSRKILKCTMHKHIEMRCSYLHSNMSLAEYTKKMGVKKAKLSGEKFDYSKKRYPWTPLTEYELDYAVTDVEALAEAISLEMEHDGDNLYSFPLTSTGYVRRDAKKAMRQVSSMYVKNQLPDFTTYQLLREAFRGGNTHANRYYANKILYDVKSADRSSSYPDIVCNCDFPISNFFNAGQLSMDEVLHLINVRRKAVLMRVALYNVKLKDEFWGSPYISKDKSRNIRGAIFDNGRILQAEYLETTITDVDLMIIMDEYEWEDCAFFDVAHARYGRLPRALIDETIKYYKAKTELKGVKEQEVYYMKSKNKLNSIYGMMAQDPVKQTIDFVYDEFIKRDDPPEELLAEHNKKAWSNYAWGVWVTAWARYRLEEGIKLAGDSFVYCDTDSVKYIGNVDWSEYNKKRITDSKKSGAYATDPQGITHYMGVYEDDGFYEEFATMGAKKYCYRENGVLHTTIAGVNKRKGGAELERYGGIEAFREGFVFREAGGTESVYNDKPEISEYVIDGHKIAITSNVMIRDSTYTLGLTAEYAKLLENPQFFIENMLTKGAHL